MAGVPGFEPGHGGIRTRCLTAWLHPKAPILQPTTLKKSGAGGENRTHTPYGART